MKRMRIKRNKYIIHSHDILPKETLHSRLSQNSKTKRTIWTREEKRSKSFRRTVCENLIKGFVECLEECALV